jgi:DMSO/TMAO reductase YedYZ heme-binding membrane subunit
MDYPSYRQLRIVCGILAFLPMMLAFCAMDFVSRLTGLDQSWEKIALFVVFFVGFLFLMIYFVRMAAGGGWKSSFRGSGRRRH